ncbi:zinc transport system permease protein [Desulfohalotomaculum tongense]|uniref:metal ABC transporter permease n=1 Tax=Desulforadius tongensis TaxID=1216062 RepID=UPI00195BF6B3|nr:metal ABC transporter permease [Desulforadius tongensis]MBM7854118.1 zinc transport system permease protein [Desulforadius tongensis]
MEIFQYGFMQKAFIIGLVVAIICPLIGLFIVLRRMSLIADALSHISLAGVAAGLLSGSNPVLSASLFAVGGGVLIENLRRRYKGYSELSIAIMLSSGVALAAILLGIGKDLNANLLTYLFGSIVVNNNTDVIIILTAGLAVLILTTLLFKELYLITFDEETAEIAGIPVKTINIVFTALTALTIALAMRIVGILMVSSLMIIPVATALQLAKSFKTALMYSVTFGLISVTAGLYLSFYLNLPPGGTIILLAVAILLCVIVTKNISSKQLHNKKNTGKATDWI